MKYGAKELINFVVFITPVEVSNHIRQYQHIVGIHDMLPFVVGKLDLLMCLGQMIYQVPWSVDMAESSFLLDCIILI